MNFHVLVYFGISFDICSFDIMFNTYGNTFIKYIKFPQTQKFKILRIIISSMHAGLRPAHATMLALGWHRGLSSEFCKGTTVTL